MWHYASSFDNRGSLHMLFTPTPDFGAAVRVTQGTIHVSLSPYLRESACVAHDFSTRLA